MPTMDNAATRHVEEEPEDVEMEKLNSGHSQQEASLLGHDDSRYYGQEHPQQQQEAAQQQATTATEQSPLLRPSIHTRQKQRNSYASHTSNDPDSSRWSRSDFTSTTIAKQEERGKLDIFIMISSYSLATGSFILIALSRSFSNLSPWIFLSIGVIGTQISAGGTSVRTALIVNAVSEDEQSTALAANQVLCTVVYATVPVLTSLIYGYGLELGLPELVWIFKALFAALAALSSMGLFVTHRGKSARSQLRDDDDDEEEENDERRDEEEEQRGSG